MNTHIVTLPSFPYDEQFVRNLLIERNGKLTDEEKENIAKNAAESAKRIIESGPA